MGSFVGIRILLFLANMLPIFLVSSKGFTILLERNSLWKIIPPKPCDEGKVFKSAWKWKGNLYSRAYVIRLRFYGIQRQTHMSQDKFIHDFIIRYGFSSRNFLLRSSFPSWGEKFPLKVRIVGMKVYSQKPSNVKFIRKSMVWETTARTKFFVFKKVYLGRRAEREHQGN